MEEEKENSIKNVSFDGVKDTEKEEKCEEAAEDVVKKTANVLKDQAFETSRVTTLKMATQYRLSLKAKPKKNKSSKVLVKRKRRNNDASSGSDSESDHHLGFLPHDMDNGLGYFDPTEDYDFDCDDTPGFGGFPEVEEKEHMCQTVYKSMCKSLHITSSSAVYKNLLGDAIILKHHLLGEKGTKALATALVDNLTVQQLHLQDNDIRDEGAVYVGDMLKENLNISDLTLSDNNIGPRGLKILMKSLETNENISSLNLSGNNFDEWDAVHIGKMLEENTIIKCLDLSHNKFRERGGVLIGHALGCNDAVEKVNLSWNHLRRDGAVAVADSLTRNISMLELNVAWNGFYLDGCKTFLKSLRVNKTLEKLNLTCNRIDLECLQLLLKGLTGNSTITHLILSNNPISSEGAYLLIKTIYDKQEMQITELDISTQSIEVKFLEVLENLRERQEIRVKHGVIMDQEGAESQKISEFNHEDPMMVLMELMRIMHLRLIDLFSALDRDQSRSLSADELKNGLMSVHVPISEKAIDRLVKKLDTDGDGEVDFGELLEGQKLHNTKLRRLKELESDLPFSETELGRIHVKLTKLISSGQALAKQKAEEQRQQRARDRLIAMGLSFSETNLSMSENKAAL